MGLSLSNGGPAGMLWMTIAAAIGIFLCDLSLAEMASMYVRRHWMANAAFNSLLFAGLRR